MDVDLNYALARFRDMTREELTEEAALHADEYVPPVRALLEDEVRARGIAPGEIEARRATRAAPAPGPVLDFPALIASSADKPEMQSLAETLRGEGLPAVVREVDARRFHCSGRAVGRWGLFVPGAHAEAAGRRLESLFEVDPAAAAAGCGGCGGGCGDEEAAALEPGDWDENGDWWKTGAPGEDEQ